MLFYTKYTHPTLICRGTDGRTDGRTDAQKIFTQYSGISSCSVGSTYKTKKCFDRTKKHGPSQYAMSKRSYKPINQEARNNVNIVNFTPQQQRQKTPDQFFLHLGDFMKGEIETMTKTADKKMQTKKRSNCSTVQMKWLHALLNLPIKTVTTSFHHLKKCKHTRENKFRNKKRDLPMKVVKTRMTMMNRFQKQLHFNLNINCVSHTEHINN